MNVLCWRCFGWVYDCFGNGKSVAERVHEQRIWEWLCQDGYLFEEVAGR